MAYGNFHDELIDLICAQTGAVRTGGDEKATLFTAVETAKISIVQYMADGLQGGKGRPRPPYWAVQIGDVRPEDERDVHAGLERVVVTIAKIDASGNDATNPTQKSVHADLEALRAVIDSPTALFDTFQSTERGRIDSSESNVVFRALAVESKVGIVAATLTWANGLQTWPPATP